MSRQTAACDVMVFDVFSWVDCFFYPDPLAFRKHTKPRGRSLLRSCNAKRKIWGRCLSTKWRRRKQSWKKRKKRWGLNMSTWIALLRETASQRFYHVQCPLHSPVVIIFAASWEVWAAEAAAPGWKDESGGEEARAGGGDECVQQKKDGSWDTDGTGAHWLLTAAVQERQRQEKVSCYFFISLSLIFFLILHIALQFLTLTIITDHSRKKCKSTYWRWLPQLLMLCMRFLKTCIYRNM